MITSAGAGVGELRVVVIGAGMAGVLMGIRLVQAGVRDLRIFEKGGSVGGTWRENSYPGLHCDFPSHVYRYSFEPNAEWSQRFSSGPEIRRYFEDVAKKYGVHDRITFNTKVVKAEWANDHWVVTTEPGVTYQADAVVSATGFLHVPHYPDIPGLASFGGPCFHSARWDHGVDLRGRRVGLIGAGSTATQLVCALADDVEKLIIFQRTPQWVARIDNPPITESERASFRANPEKMATMFQSLYKEMVALADGAIQGRDAGLRQWLEQNVRENLARVKDPVLRAKLTPSYKPGCKRLVMSPGFYESVQKPTVELVTEKIARIEPSAVCTTDGQRKNLDVLVLATGFDPQAYFLPMDLIGEEGRRIEDIWEDGPIAFRSMTIPFMPNFFMIEGPFSPVGNVSAVLIAEWQAEYIGRCILAMAGAHAAMTPDLERTRQMMKEYKAATRNTIWYTGGCRSWYLDRDGLPILYPYTADRFEREMRAAPDLSEYRVTQLPVGGSVA